MKKINDNRFVICRKGRMNVDVDVFFPPRKEPDKAALEHLRNASRLPSAIRVAGLPNLTSESSFVSGCVVGTSDIIVPGIIGEDINAGIRLISTPVKAGDVRFQQIDGEIRKAVPFGEKSTNLKMHEGDFRLLLEFGIAGLSDVTNKAGGFWKARVESEEESDAQKTEENGSVPSTSSSISHHAIKRGQNQLGTAGGTGHLIDIQTVEGIFDDKAAKELGLFKDQLVITFNAGSRGFGHQVTEDYVRLARDLNGEKAPERELSFFETQSGEAEPYLQAYGCAANFAFVNRQLITTLIRYAVRKVTGRKPMPLICDVAYNTLRYEEHGSRRIWVHRRGAGIAMATVGIALRNPGSMVVISGSPSSASYLVAAGEKCGLTLNSLCINAGFTPQRDEATNSKGYVTSRRSVDGIIRCLVDSGLVRIIARLKSLTHIQA